MDGLKGKYLGLILTVILTATLIPVSTTYAKSQEEESAAKLVELADRAGERVQNFIDLIYSNETAITTIQQDPDLWTQLESNVSLFDTLGMGNLSNAYEALVEDEFEWATSNATQAMSIFREVFKELNKILTSAGVARGELVDAQGLLQAYRRALDRIERMRDLTGLTVEIEATISEAESYLDLEEARAWLVAGRVNETAHNLTMANKLISQSMNGFRKVAKALNKGRVEAYLQIIEKLYERIEHSLNIAESKKGVDVDDLRTQLEEAKTLTEEARSFVEATPLDIESVTANLNNARDKLQSIQEELKELKKGGGP